jgi:hypothetical protein
VGGCAGKGGGMTGILCAPADVGGAKRETGDGELEGTTDAGE